MTNREWLCIMSDEDFIKWLYIEKSYYFEDGKKVVVYKRFSPTKHEVTDCQISAPARLREWLKEEREE